MAKTASKRSENRITIKAFLVEWLQGIGTQEIGTTDLGEIVNYLLLVHRAGKCNVMATASIATKPQQRLTTKTGSGSGVLLDEGELADSLSDLLT